MPGARNGAQAMPSARGVFKYFIFDFASCGMVPKPLPDGLRLGVFHPSWGRFRVNHFTSIWLYLFWFVFSKRKYRIYYLADQDRIVHLSHVISKNPKFPFLGPDDFEIGPCWTDPEYRGQGLYPHVLSQIANDFQDHVGELFIFAEEKNKASLAGISKLGFNYIGSGSKTGLLGVYRITQPATNEE